jgi:hypothetical protein
VEIIKYILILWLLSNYEIKELYSFVIYLFLYSANNKIIIQRLHLTNIFLLNTGLKQLQPLLQHNVIPRYNPWSQSLEQTFFLKILFGYSEFWNKMKRL